MRKWGARFSWKFVRISGWVGWCLKEYFFGRQEKAGTLFNFVQSYRGRRLKIIGYNNHFFRGGRDEKWRRNICMEESYENMFSWLKMAAKKYLKYESNRGCWDNNFRHGANIIFNGPIRPSFLAAYPTLFSSLSSRFCRSRRSYRSHWSQKCMWLPRSPIT